MSITILWFNDANAAVSAMFDIDEQETHDLQNIITEHPIDAGSNISDNVRPQLDRFTIQGYVSDTPLLANPGVVGIASFVEIELQIPDYPIQVGEAGLIQAGVGAVGNAIFGKPKTKATLMKLSDSASRKRAMFQALKDVRDNARVCRILTTMHTYEQMEIEQITATRAPGDGNGAVFTISLKQIDFATTEDVEAPDPTEITGSVINASGSKNTSDDSKKVSDANDTLALKLFNKGKGLF